MRFIKKYENFVASPQPAVKPAQPTTKPGTKPGQPATRPSRPGPIPTIKPQVDPLPKAKVTEDDIYNRFILELKKLGNKPVDLDLDELKSRYAETEELESIEEKVINDFKSLVKEGYSVDEAYQEVIATYDEEVLTQQILDELNKFRKGENK